MYENCSFKAKNEIDLLIRLDHPSIVNIYEVYEEDDVIILVLEYMKGGELYPHIGLQKYFTEAQVREYMRTLIDAVRYCHDLNIVHRDIKVSSVALSPKTCY